MKTQLKLDKQVVFEVVVALILIGISAWLYFGGALSQNGKVYFTQDLEIRCESLDGLPQIAKDDVTASLKEIFSKETLTQKELGDLLPVDCYVAEPQPTPIAGSCLLLEQQYCGFSQNVMFNRYPSHGFLLPEGTPFFSPFTGALFTEEPEGPLSYKVVYVVMKDSSATVVFVGDITSTVASGADVTKGKWIGNVTNQIEPVDADGKFNVAVYGTNYELDSLFYGDE